MKFCPTNVETATGTFDPVGYDDPNMCAGCGTPHSEHTDQAGEFRCRVCGIDCDTAPKPPEKAVCSAHCEDHDYEYEPELRGRYCTHCSQEAPDDYYEN